MDTSKISLGPPKKNKTIKTKIRVGKELPQLDMFDGVKESVLKEEDNHVRADSFVDKALFCPEYYKGFICGLYFARVKYFDILFAVRDSKIQKLLTLCYIKVKEMEDQIEIFRERLGLVSPKDKDFLKDGEKNE
jgi:hypothetical protein